MLTEHSQLQGLQTARAEGTAAREALLCEQFLLMPLVGESNGVFILAGVSYHSSPATGDRFQRHGEVLVRIKINRDNTDDKLMSKTESHTTLPPGRSQVGNPGEERVFTQCEDLSTKYSLKEETIAPRGAAWKTSFSPSTPNEHLQSQKRSEPHGILRCSRKDAGSPCATVPTGVCLAWVEDR